MGSKTSDVVFEEEDAARLRALIRAHGEHAVADRLGVGVNTIARAASGCRVQRSTHELVRLKLAAWTKDDPERKG